ncbi:MAG: hypothetical protein FWE85_06070, partial [Clostridiales bacterium]|nr:hypothetical protein [Clostridiales bacterium]
MINTARLFTDERDYVKSAIARKGYDVSTVDRLIDVLSVVKGKRTALDNMRRQRNEQQSDQSIPVEEKRALRDEIAGVEKELAALDAEASDLLYDVPNLPDDGAPDGADESGNVIVETCGEDHYHCQAENPL